MHFQIVALSAALPHAIFEPFAEIRAKSRRLGLARNVRMGGTMAHLGTLRTPQPCIERETERPSGVQSRVIRPEFDSFDDEDQLPLDFIAFLGARMGVADDVAESVLGNLLTRYEPLQRHEIYVLAPSA